MNIIYKEKVIEINPEKTILENLEIAKMKPYSMCRAGFCATCKMTLIDGEIEYFEEPLAILEKNEFLPCICKAKSDIKIEI